jgi:hypothetical protein
MNQEIEWGLTACGRSGETSIDLNESISGPEIYELEISKSNWYLRLRIANTKVVIELLEFFRNSNSQEFHIGIFNGLQAYIFRDSEFKDRFFIAINGQSGAMQYTIAGEAEIKEFITTLEQTSRDLQ